MEYTLHNIGKTSKRLRELGYNDDTNLMQWDPILVPQYNYLIPIAQIYSKIRAGIYNQNNFMQNLWMTQNVTQLKPPPKLPDTQQKTPESQQKTPDTLPSTPKSQVSKVDGTEYIDLKNVFDMYNSVIDLLNKANMYGDLIKYSNELDGINSKNRLVPFKVSKIKLSNYIFPADDDTLKLINYVNECIVFILESIDYITDPIVK